MSIRIPALPDTVRRQSAVSFGLVGVGVKPKLHADQPAESVVFEMGHLREVLVIIILDTGHPVVVIVAVFEARLVEGRGPISSEMGDSTIARHRSVDAHPPGIMAS